MSRDRVYIAGAFEHPTREAPDSSTMELHAEVAEGALADAGLSHSTVDGYFTAGGPSIETLVMADYLGLWVDYMDTTDYGGWSYVAHVGHAASSIRDGKCDVALVSLVGRPRSAGQATGTGAREQTSVQDSFERIYGATNVSLYALAARRHMHEYGTTSEQLAEIRVAAAHHAQYNDDAMFQAPVSVSDVVESRTVAAPLHLLDCCVISDGGGAVVVVSDDVRSELDRECVEILGHGEAPRHHDGGRIDITRTGQSNLAPARSKKRVSDPNTWITRPSTIRSR